MKLQTSIAPRLDGTVRVKCKDGKTTVVFEPGPDGQLTAEVADEATVKHLLAGGLFWPANEADFDVALTLANKNDGAGDPEGADDDDKDDLDANPNALPVEANTKPAPARAKHATAKTARNKAK